jgi:hypothetical protein
MSRKQFTNRNNINNVLTFQKSGSTSSFDPTITFSSGSKRVSWRLDNGTNKTQTAGNSITYTGFTSDTGIRTIEMRGNNFNNISNLDFSNDNLYGGIDLSKIKNFSNLSSIYLHQNPNLSGITNPSCSNTFSNYQIYSSNLTGNLDMTPISGNISSFIVNSNTNLTGITHNTVSNIVAGYNAYSCNLKGNLNLPFTGFGGSLQVYSNPNLTGITVSSPNNVSQFFAYSCNLTGNLDLSQLTNLSGDIRLQFNPNLTGITHANSSNNITNYTVYNCNLTGNLDLTPLSGLGGNFQVYSNSGLTSITHSPSPNNFTQYNVASCNLIGNLDLTPLSGFGGLVSIVNNPNLTGITNPVSIRNFTEYSLNSCGLIGILDLTPLSNFGGASSASTCIVGVSDNPLLSGVTFPVVNTYFKNNNNNDALAAFRMFQSNLDYIDFKPLSGATLISGATQGAPRIRLQNNNMSTSDVNHILVDFSGNATYNPSGWSNVNLNIGGTNGDPDSSSGGYDGLAAIAFLTGSPYNWIITY